MSRQPRIPPVAPGDEATAELFGKVLNHDGRVLNAASTLAHHPRLLKRFTVFAGLFLTHTLLPERDRELITLRCTHRFGSEYYFGHHVLLAAKVLTPAEIARTVAAPSEWQGFDRQLLDAIDELAETADLSDITWSQLSAHYDDPQLLDLVMLVGFYRMTCQYVNTIGVEREPGVPGWPSERTQP
jgi:4-carboxymuconolactone decarboxylase